MDQQEQFMAVADNDDDSDFLVTTLGMAALALIGFSLVLFVLAFTEAGREKAKVLIKE